MIHGYNGLVHHFSEWVHCRCPAALSSLWNIALPFLKKQTHPPFYHLHLLLFDRINITPSQFMHATDHFFSYYKSYQRADFTFHRVFYKSARLYSCELQHYLPTIWAGLVQTDWTPPLCFKRPLFVCLHFLFSIVS